jgi:hypothetical protein
MGSVLAGRVVSSLRPDPGTSGLPANLSVPRTRARAAGDDIEVAHRPAAAPTALDIHPGI